MFANISSAEVLASLPPSQQQKILAELSEAELAGLEFDWSFVSDALTPLG